MRSLRSILFSFLVIIVITFLVFYRFQISRLIRNGLINPDEQEWQRLRLENESLKLQLARLQDKKEEKNNFLVGELYSLYPFNDQTRLIVNLGKKDGLKEGQVVLAAEGILLGRISAVKNNLSEIQTIFDPHWRSSVGIGRNGFKKALLIGGPQPLLTLINKDNLPKVGDEVFNLSPEYPYGLLIGRVLAVEVTEAKPWATASLETFYNPNLLEKVLIVKE